MDDLMLQIGVKIAENANKSIEKFAAEAQKKFENFNINVNTASLENALNSLASRIESGMGGATKGFASVSKQSGKSATESVIADIKSITEAAQEAMSVLNSISVTPVTAPTTTAPKPAASSGSSASSTSGAKSTPTSTTTKARHQIDVEVRRRKGALDY